jgi:hypothetical protein
MEGGVVQEKSRTRSHTDIERWNITHTHPGEVYDSSLERPSPVGSRQMVFMGIKHTQHKNDLLEGCSLIYRQHRFYTKRRWATVDTHTTPGVIIPFWIEDIVGDKMHPFLGELDHNSKSCICPKITQCSHSHLRLYTLR